MYGMMDFLANVEKIYISSFNTSKVTNMSYIFSDCTKLTNIYVGDGWDVSAVTTSTSMFLNSPNLPNYNSSVVDKTNAHYGEGGYLTHYIGEFTIESNTYQFEYGMTFVEWAYSSYNTSGSYKLYNSLDSTNNFLVDSGLSMKRNDVTVLCNDLINGGDILTIDLSNAQ